MEGREAVLGARTDFCTRPAQLRNHSGVALPRCKVQRSPAECVSLPDDPLQRPRLPRSFQFCALRQLRLHAQQIPLARRRPQART